MLLAIRTFLLVGVGDVKSHRVFGKSGSVQLVLGHKRVNHVVESDIGYTLLAVDFDFNDGAIVCPVLEGLQNIVFL